VAAAYVRAVRAGLSPVEFWQLTPYLTRLAVTALDDKAVTDAWLVAAMSRQKKLQRLEELTSKPRKAPPKDLQAKMRLLLGGKA